MVGLIILFVLLNGLTLGCPRIVSLAPSVTETVEYLGKGECIVATTVYSKDRREKIGGLVDPDIEKIIRLKPDVVISSTLTPRDKIRALEGAGIKVVVLRWDTLGDIEENIRIIGKILGVKDAEKKAKLFRKALSFKEEIKGSALIFVGCKELIVAGKGTYLSDIFEMKGFKNIATREGWYRINLEYIYNVKPDFIFTFCDLTVRLPEHIKVVRITSDRLLKPSPFVIYALGEIGRIGK